jgi:hypothetical protein
MADAWDKVTIKIDQELISTVKTNHIHAADAKTTKRSQPNTRSPRRCWRTWIGHAIAQHMVGIESSPRNTPAFAKTARCLGCDPTVWGGDTNKSAKRTINKATLAANANVATTSKYAPTRDRISDKFLSFGMT